MADVYKGMAEQRVMSALRKPWEERSRPVIMGDNSVTLNVMTIAEHWVEHPHDYDKEKLSSWPVFAGQGYIYKLKNIKTGESHIYTRSELQAALNTRIEKSYQDHAWKRDLSPAAKRYHATILTEWLNT